LLRPAPARAAAVAGAIGSFRGIPTVPRLGLAAWDETDTREGSHGCQYEAVKK
jgi:hypothetical protein